MTQISLRSCADDYDPDSMTVGKAREFIQRFLTPIATTERVAIRAALSRIVAADIVSPIDVPAHDNSAMDGYAVRFADLGISTRLKVAGTAFAGKPFGRAVTSGEAVRIMTGAVVPEGANTIVMQEQASAAEGFVEIRGEHRSGQHLRRAGEDLRAGQVVLKRGHWLRPAELGLLSSLGIAEVPVFRRLRVAFFSTGDELRSLGETLGIGEIYDSNRYTLHGMLTRLGVDVIDMGVVKDEPKLLEEAFVEASSVADVVITSGGVSVGEADYVKELLSRLGEVVFWKIAMKPGRPLAYGKIGEAHFFGLPGNPVSVMVTFYHFVQDALWKLMGRSEIPFASTVQAVCVTALKKAPGRIEFQRGVLYRESDGTLSVRVTGEQGSGILRSMAEANCFIVLPDSQGSVAAGSVVDVQPMEGLI
ncbi:MAG: molybdopterin molybdotransferase MoeA [Burkholderiales bacterium]